MTRIARYLRAILGRSGRNLQVRLVGSFVALAAVTVTIVASVAFVQARAAHRNAVLDRISAVAAIKEGEIERWILDQRAGIEFLAGLSALVRAAAYAGHEHVQPRLTAFLDSAATRALNIGELFILSVPGGRVIASSRPANIGDYRVDDLYYGRGQVGTFIQNVYPSPVSARPTLTIATPMRDTSGTVAVLVGHLDLRRMEETLEDRTGLGETGEAYLVSRFNDFVSAERFGRAAHRRGVHTDGVARALRGEQGADTYVGYQGLPVLGAYRWLEDRELALLVEISEREALAPARPLLWAVLAFGMGVIGVLAIGVLLIVRRATRPIRALTDAATRIADGDFRVTAPVTTRDELGVLARAFNKMTGRLTDLNRDLSRQVDATGDALRALADSKHLLQAIIDNSSALIVVADPEGRLLLVNRRFETIFDLDPGRAEHRLPAEVLRPPAGARIRQLTQDAFRSQETVERDLVVGVRGRSRHYHAVAFPLRDGDGNAFGVGLIAADLTERKRVEEERLRLEGEMQHAQKLESLGLLAGGIAHDFNNLLAGILGNAELAGQHLAPGADGRTELDQVVRAAERAASLTHQMLAYAGRASFRVETFDLNGIIREMGELLEASRPKKVAVQYELAADLPPVTADPTQISQVVMNLITNATEAVGDDGGSVLVQTALVDRQLRLHVSDTGCGMAADIVQRIFDPFFTTKRAGRGLGLAAVLGIVRSSGGSVDVDTGPGEGTTFTVSLPAATAPVPAERHAPEPDPAADGGTVLVVDDEDIIRETAVKILGRFGYRVVTAADGREGVEQFAARKDAIVAVVLDMTMPVMGGAETFAELRALDPTVPVVLSSGYDEQDTAGAFVDGDVLFLQKPYHIKALVERVREAVRRRAKAACQVPATG